uniref:Uncharacterized protein n=1 Tax=Leersia perrieri TaxID=77586 RepID=A0A0D9XUX3_9ORYZ
MATPINLNTTNVNDILDLEIGMGNTTIRHTAIQEDDDEAMSPHITKRTIKKSPQPDTTQSDLRRRLLPSSHK